jgi:hypothetical protein
LACPDGGRSRGDVGTAQLRTVREHPSSFLLDGHTVKAGLEPEALRYLVVKIPDNDGGHDGASISC